MHHFHEWNDYTEDDDACDDEKAQENADMVEAEFESLSAILTEQEYHKFDDIDAKLAESSLTSLKDVLHVLNISIVPNFEGKLHAKDKVKGMQVELRSFPAVELTCVLVKSYPSSRAPLMALRGSFYQKYKSTLFM